MKNYLSLSFNACKKSSALAAACVLTLAASSVVQAATSQRTEQAVKAAVSVSVSATNTSYAQMQSRASVAAPATARYLRSQRSDRTTVMVDSTRDVPLDSTELANPAKAASHRAERVRAGSVFAPTNTQAALNWQPVSNSVEGAAGYVAQLEIKALGARAVRAKLALPAGVVLLELRAVASTTATSAAEVMRVTAGVMVEGNSIVWTPVTDGDAQIIELFSISRPTANTVEVLQITQLDQPFFSPNTGTTEKAQGAAASANFTKIPPENARPLLAGTCSPDVVCTSNNAALDTAIAERKKSVARIGFNTTTGFYYCTGTLLNTAKFPTAYFLTANHCISNEDEAKSITSLWFYEAPTCGGVASPGQVQSAGGASLVFTNYMVDSTLLRLNGTPPSGSIFAGFNAAPLATGAAVTSISHPTGDIMKFATGAIVQSVRTVDYPFDLNAVKYSRGVTEVGSSGSGLFTLNGSSLQLRGILSGTTVRETGGLKCGNTQDVGLYGPFDLFYPQIQSIIETPPAGFPSGDTDTNQPSGTARAINLSAIDAKGSATGAITATINYAGDLDVFRINVPQDGQITVFSTGGKDLVGALLSSTGAGLESSDGHTQTDEGFAFGITRRVTAGTYFLSVGHFDAAGTGDYGITAQFSTALDNYTDLWWNTPEESGWGININHQGNTLFATLFTYEIGGAGLWLVMSNGTRQADGSYKGELYRTIGSAFNATPFNPATATKVGDMSLRFSDKNRATLVYDFNGITVTKTITRQIFQKQPVCKFSAFDRSFDFNYQDLWWNAAESGWGVNITHQEKVLFATLFNYDATGKGLWLVMSEGKEISRTDKLVVYQGDLYRTTGPAFNTTPWSAIAVAPVGKMKFEFTDGNNGTLSYDLNGIVVTKKIQRQVFGNPATSCDQP